MSGEILLLIKRECRELTNEYAQNVVLQEHLHLGVHFSPFLLLPLLGLGSLQSLRILQTHIGSISTIIEDLELWNLEERVKPQRTQIISLSLEVE